MAPTLPALAQQTGTQAAPEAKPAAKPEAKPAKAAVKVKSASGTVKSVSADSLTLVGKDNKEWTFALTKDTKIHKGGKAIEAKDLAEQDAVSVRYTEAEGKMTATSVTVRTAKAAAKPKS